jgi:hypothetical protein
MYNPVNYDQISYAFHTMNIDQNPYYIQQIADIQENNGMTPGFAQQVQKDNHEHFTVGGPANQLPGFDFDSYNKLSKNKPYR